MRCDEYQGFLNNRALDPVEFAKLLEERERSTAALA